MLLSDLFQSAALPMIPTQQYIVTNNLVGSQTSQQVTLWHVEHCYPPIYMHFHHTLYKMSMPLLLTNYRPLRPGIDVLVMPTISQSLTW